MRARNLLGERLELVRVARGQDGPVASRGERMCNRCTKAARGTDHEDVTTTLHHGPLYSAPSPLAGS